MNSKSLVNCFVRNHQYFEKFANKQISLRGLLRDGFIWSRNAKCYFFAIFYTVFLMKIPPKYCKNTCFSKLINTHVYAQWVKMLFFSSKILFLFSPKNTANFFCKDGILVKVPVHDHGIILWSKCCVPGIQPCKKNNVFFYIIDQLQIIMHVF